MKTILSMNAVNSALTIASHGDIAPVGQQNLVRALAVLLMDQRINSFLVANDPQSLNQAIVAVEAAAGDFWIR